MNEQNLLARWTLEAEDPKAFNDLQLAVERARVSGKYARGRSPAELELAAQQNDLRRRQEKYIADEQAKARTGFLTGGVGGPRSSDYDFGNAAPYLQGSKNYRGVLAPKATKTPVDAQANKAAFDAEVKQREADRLLAIGEGQTAARVKASGNAERAARLKNAGIDGPDWGAGVALATGGLPSVSGRQAPSFDVTAINGVSNRSQAQTARSGGTITRGGQTFDVPRGGDFSTSREQQAADASGFASSNILAPLRPAGTPQTGPRMANVRQPVQPPPTVAPATDPVDFGSPEEANETDSDDEQSEGDQFEPGPAYRGAGAGGEWEPNPTPQARATTPGRTMGTPMGAAMGAAREIYRALSPTLPSSYPNAGFYGNDPKFIDRRKKPSTLAPTVTPIATRY